MAEPGLDEGWRVRAVIDPVEEPARFGFQTVCGRRLEMHMLPADRPGHYLHWATGIVTPSANLDLG